jgi:hypothetical protein
MPTNVSAAYKAWQEHCKNIQDLTTVNTAEPPAAKQQRIARARDDYGFFVNYYFPHFATTQSAKFHLVAAKYIKEHDNTKAVFEWARGHAKSTHMGVMIPMWLKIQNPRQINVMLLASKSEDAAIRLLSDLQAEFSSNQRYIHDFGQQFNHGSWQEGEFHTIDNCMFIAYGRGQSPRGIKERGKRPDYIVIDDIDDDELVQNEKRVNKVVDWCIEALGGTMDMWRGRFIVVGNRIAKHSVLGLLSQRPDIYHTRVCALDNNGNPSWPEKYSRQEILKVREFMGERRFQKEYMNNPVSEGSVFKNEWIRWGKMLPWKKYDHLIAYCDPSFKGTTKNDYKAIKVWGKIGTQLHHPKAFVRQCSISTMVKWWYDFHESLPDGVICDYYIEASFYQDIILDEFTAEGNTRGYQLPIRPDKRSKPDKFQRIEAISPLWERGFVTYNEQEQNDPDMQRGLEQTLAIEKGSRVADDGPDADEGAIFLLQKRTRTETFTPSFGKRRSTISNY